jgi:hypothetical protein
VKQKELLHRRNCLTHEIYYQFFFVLCVCVCVLCVCVLCVCVCCVCVVCVLCVCVCVFFYSLIKHAPLPWVILHAVGIQLGSIDMDMSYMRVLHIKVAHRASHK